ncbi:hypothetical protein G7Y89_g5488 [Cudoniella acicularis]|uniref:C2H2-type domain-containing protein n=1 Tax=Cudoniella acicularis TaxID=354080 RepID=A0A8H4RPM9_9HELO|nr:hypothetical protein G7Y89_g5488 [Cudoniella acicularis]
MTRLKLDQWEGRWSYARGATKATKRAGGQSIAELGEALAEVDGLLAGLNYLEKAEPDSHEPSSRGSSPSQGGNLSFSSEERLNIETRHLRNHLVGKLAKSNDNPSRPRDSQWATLRSLREASRYYYDQFVKLTAVSTSRDIRRLGKSFGTAKNMLEIGILTFRDVLHGKTPESLEQVFAFASLSYMISKSLHAKGHLEESDILSGLLDWRSVIANEKEQLAFDEIAKLLWPEAKEILHFIPIQRRNVGLRHDTSELMSAPPNTTEVLLNPAALVPTEGAFTPEDQLPDVPQWDHEHAPIPPLNMIPEPFLDDLEMDPPDRVCEHLYHLLGETSAHPDFEFAKFLNVGIPEQETLMDSTSYSTVTPPPYINPRALQLPSSLGGNSDKPPLPPNCRSSPPNPHLEHSTGEKLDSPSFQPMQDIRDSAMFQLVLDFIDQISEMGDLLDVLSARQMRADKNGTNSLPSSQSWIEFEFFNQAPILVLNPLYSKATHSDKTFCGIIAMAETFVRLGLLHTVREVEDYIIDVGRSLAQSYDLFVSLVSHTLNQCLKASRSLKWGLVYLSGVEEADEYSTAYIKKRKQHENEWASTVLACHEPSQQLPPPTSSTDDSYRKHPRNPLKRRPDEGSDLPEKRQRREIPDIAPQIPLPHSDTLAVLCCPYEYCPKRFRGASAPNNRSRHVRVEHEKRNILRCPSCSTETGRRDNLRKHFLKKHPSYVLPGWLASTARGLSSA